jgi:hypothetical protein
MSLPRGKISKNLDKESLVNNPFVLFNSHPDDFHKIIKESKIDSRLEKLFFHPKNIRNIQKQIILQVFYKTNKRFLIRKQNESDLRFIMQNILETYGRDHIDNITDRIRELNNKVVETVVPGIIENIDFQENHIKTIDKPIILMDRPKNVSNAGRKMFPISMR